MATLDTSSPVFVRLVAAWRLLAGRKDIDDLIVETLGRFSLEKIYADSDKHTYSHLVLTLLIQLDTIFFIQRLSLPPESQSAVWYLGHLVSWEVALRTIEFVTQCVTEAGESLWEIQPLATEYLARVLLSVLRILSLHPKGPRDIRSTDSRDRYAGVHRCLELMCDNHPHSRSFLLLLCKDVASALSTKPEMLDLPLSLKYELPSLASNLDPLASSLSPQYIHNIVSSQNIAPDDWLSQYLALYDISQFVVGSSIQCVANEEIRDIGLQTASTRTRNAVIQGLDRIQTPAHLPRSGISAPIIDTFRIIFSDTPHGAGARRSSLRDGETEIKVNALSVFCTRLIDRQTAHRASDREMMRNISAITRHLSRFDDTSNRELRPPTPRLYVINCRRCHLVGSSQIRELLNVQSRIDTEESQEMSLPDGTTCPFCRETVSMLREISIARHAWELLNPLQSSSDTIDMERHQPSQFKLSPLKREAARSSADACRRSLVSLEQVPSNQKSSLSTSDRSRTFSDAQESLESAQEQPFSPDFVGYGTSIPGRRQSSNPESSVVSLPYQTTQDIQLPDSEKHKSKWKTRLTLSRRDTKSSGDTSSLSTSGVESESLEEISLKDMISASKSSGKGRINRNISVNLSQNSTDAVFWTQSFLGIWDVGISPPALRQYITTDGSCVLSGISKSYLAYIIGSRDRTLTLRIKSVEQQPTVAVGYRMESTPWCKSMAISPTGNTVAVGFENAIVRIYDATGSLPPKGIRLHLSQHKECKNCPPVDTLSFSNDGLVLLGSTRTRTGVVQIFSSNFPFRDVQEMTSCRYTVPMHESEDNGVSSAIFQPTAGGEGMICITTWTQSGTPVLVQSKGGYRSDIRPQGHHSKLGNRIQSAAFSPSGKELALVNDKGHLYRISNLNSLPMEIRKIATSKEFTTKSDSFSMSFVSLPEDGEAIILAWTDASKGSAFVKTISVTSTIGDLITSPATVVASPKINSTTTTPPVQHGYSELFGDIKAFKPPVELSAGNENISKVMWDRT